MVKKKLLYLYLLNLKNQYEFNSQESGRNKNAAKYF